MYFFYNRQKIGRVPLQRLGDQHSLWRASSICVHRFASTEHQHHQYISNVFPTNWKEFWWNTWLLLYWSGSFRRLQRSDHSVPPRGPGAEVHQHVERAQRQCQDPGLGWDKVICFQILLISMITVSCQSAPQELALLWQLWLLRFCLGHWGEAGHSVWAAWA